MGGHAGNKSSVISIETIVDRNDLFGINNVPMGRNDASINPILGFVPELEGMPSTLGVKDRGHTAQDSHQNFVALDQLQV